ncbi:MAG: glycosyltransferase family 4 protein [Candidatus Taylorbacteria bacterium]|nr:glycosyltransferase family 4 protein [Candidatus Taylorbacteria bacterium]
MKILYIITKSNWGGAGRHVYDLATNMKEQGHEVKVALGGSGTLKTRLESAGIFTYSIADMGRDISVGKDAGSLRQIFSVIKSQKPDILHLHSPKAAGLGSLAGRLLGVKNIIMTVHGWTWNEDRPWYERLGIIFVSWLTGILCHRIIVISKHDHDQAMRLPGLERKIIFVPLGIRPSPLVSVDGAKQFMAKAINMDVADFNKKTIIGTIAELHRNKGLTFLIEAMAMIVTKFPSASCIIMGEGEERTRLQTLIREKGLEQQVFLLGYVEDAAQYLKAFSIFVLPSIKEGLPYTIIEAGAASLPVVATTVGGIPDIIHDMESGILVQPKDSRDLAHALMFTIEHPKESRGYGAHLKETITSVFSLQKMLESLSRIYSGN